MLLLIIFLASFAAILAVYYMFKVPFIPFKDKWDDVIFNIGMALVLAFMFDRFSIVLAAIVLAAKLVYEKFKQAKKKIEDKVNSVTKPRDESNGTV